LPRLRGAQRLLEDELTHGEQVRVPQEDTDGVHVACQRLVGAPFDLHRHTDDEDHGALELRVVEDQREGVGRRVGAGRHHG